MTIASAFVLILCLLGLMVGVCLLYQYFEKHSEHKEYDERQKLAQGKGCRLAFLVLQVYLLLILFVDMAVGLEWISLQLVVLLGIIVGMFTFNTYCVLNCASLPVGEKPGRSALFSGAMALLWFVQFFTYLDGETVLPMTGKGSYHWMRLLLGMIFAYNALGYFIEYLREKKG